MIIFESAKVTLVAVGVRDGARSGGGASVRGWQSRLWERPQTEVTIREPEQWRYELRDAKVEENGELGHWRAS